MKKKKNKKKDTYTPIRLRGKTPPVEISLPDIKGTARLHFESGRQAKSLVGKREKKISVTVESYREPVKNGFDLEGESHMDAVGEEEEKTLKRKSVAQLLERVEIQPLYPRCPEG